METPVLNGKLPGPLTVGISMDLHIEVTGNCTILGISIKKFPVFPAAFQLSRPDFQEKVSSWFQLETYDS